MMKNALAVAENTITYEY